MSSLIPIFCDKLIPWAQRDFEQRLVIAKPRMKQTDVPYGVELSHQKIPGKRVLVRTHDDGSQKVIRARWPEAGLHELYNPRLVCVLKGVTNYRAGNYIITSNEGHFIVLPPRTANTTGNVSHLEGESRRFGSCDLIQFNVYQDYIRCTLCYSRGEKHWPESECFITDPFTVQMFQRFIEEAIAPQERSILLCRSLLTSFFTLLWRGLKNGLHQECPPRTKSTFSDDFVERVYDHIKTHVHESPTIEKVAQSLYMSSSQFTRHIRQETGKSFVEILTEYRIEKSKRLLRDTKWSVAAIARDIGFKSSTYFITFFKKHVGSAPGEYRDKTEGENAGLTSG